MALTDIVNPDGDSNQVLTIPSDGLNTPADILFDNRGQFIVEIPPQEIVSASVN